MGANNTMMARDWPRPAGALALAVVTTLGLRGAHAGWASALLAGAALALLTAWRTIPGVVAAFGAFAGAAALAWTGHPDDALGTLSAALPGALGLEGFGLLTIAAVAWLRSPRRISRRLLGSFLATTGIGLLGVALCASSGTAAAGSALIAGALAYRLGAAPAYAWLPMLLRHPRRSVNLMGAAGVVFAGAVLAQVLPLLPDRAPAAAALGVLSLATMPWAGWRAWQQRVTDPPCARTYVFVIAVSVVLLVVAVRIAR